MDKTSFNNLFREHNFEKILGWASTIRCFKSEQLCNIASDNLRLWKYPWASFWLTIAIIINQK